ncbi:short-chain dehydrogenase [Cadophora sp. DSE1049]|nr:short-chain dehydrogenase [Cadophora sp. DSE1049]
MSQFNANTSGAEVVAAFPDRVERKTFVITGPTAGSLGSQTAIFIAAGKPSNIILLGRTASKVAPVISEIQTISPSTKAQFIPLDLTRFDSIRAAAATINSTVDKIDVLINNAGIMGVSKYTLTPEGIESQFAANHIGHFLLTSLLMPKLEAAGNGARIVNLSSSGHQLGEVRLDDYNFDDGKDYDPWAAYGQSKTANILFTVSLAEKLASRGILAFSVHPGSIADTQLGTHVEMSMWGHVSQLFVDRGFPNPMMSPLKSLAAGTSSTLYAALDPSLKASDSGSYIADATITETPDYAHNPTIAEKLWILSEKIVGEKFQL